jgi:hypothetical protein
MSDLRLRLPDSLHQKVREIADRDEVSINQFIATAVAEKAAAYLTVEYLEERARRADPSLFRRLLDRVPDVPPIPGDELAPDARVRKRRARVVRRRQGKGRS